MCDCHTSPGDPTCTECHTGIPRDRAHGDHEKPEEAAPKTPLEQLLDRIPDDAEIPEWKSASDLDRMARKSHAIRQRRSRNEYRTKGQVPFDVKNQGQLSRGNRG